MSYNLVDPTTGDLTLVAGRNAIDDGSVSETSVWSSQKTSSKIAEKVGKTDIATTIDGKSTDTQVPSAKAVWNKSKNKIQRLLDGVDIIVYADSISNEMATDTVRIMNAINSPYGVDNVNNDFHYTIYNINDDKYKRILAYDIRKNDMYMIVKNNNIWGTWAKLATMDKVGNAQIIGFKTNRLNQCYGYYTIGNNKVSVHMKFVLSSALDDWEILTNVNLPAPSSAVTKNANGKTGASNSVYITTEGRMQQSGGGGMSAGTYEFDFEYTTA